MALPSVRFLELFVLPPNSVARLGGSEVPLECYTWGDDPTIAGRATTVVEPAVSFEVVPDGSIRPYLPANLRFHDNGRTRPVAPFLELWARTLDGGKEAEGPVTLDLLERAGASTANLAFRVTAANRKAERRAGDPACGFVAQATAAGTDHAPQLLLAISPNPPGSQPLVPFDRPIPLGRFQVIRPLKAADMGVDLSIVRVRFTPAAGEVYGPPTAVVGVSPGTDRSHVMVKPENRFLNPGSAWSRYDASYARFRNPEPSDTYDGADTDASVSWGVVDDTCDVLVECDLVVAGVRFQAQARVAVAPPHFAPDRRPFVSLADDLKDRDDQPPGDGAAAAEAEPLTDLEQRINDLFQRALEVAGLFNVDANRNRAIGTNEPLPRVAGEARIDAGMMTADDKPFADLSADAGQSVPHDRLPLSDLVPTAHGPFADLDSMVAKLREEADRVRLMVRPPYGRFRELPDVPADGPNPRFRDPRVPRDGQYDMRMPPFMRDSDATAMSLTHRQYADLMALVEALEAKKRERGLAAGAAPSVADDTPIRRRVAEFIRSQARVRAVPNETPPG